MYPITPVIERRYLQNFMLANVFVQQSATEDNRAAMTKINQESLAKILVAVPPLAEQHRIIAKFDAPMALCDRLEANPTASAAIRHRLPDALLAEALAPAKSNRDVAP